MADPKDFNTKKEPNVEERSDIDKRNLEKKLLIWKNCLHPSTNGGPPLHLPRPWKPPRHRATQFTVSDLHTGYYIIQGKLDDALAGYVQCRFKSFLVYTRLNEVQLVLNRHGLLLFDSEDLSAQVLMAFSLLQPSPLRCGQEQGTAETAT
ncbi:hypothetical protein HYFRA_00013280 [Hymenoscyphus fraxineus]|uniref:Uncharacterized protein n=1 Tax=Hymenoscyphus fraxineus TaxID=746836 RepID=A0A9N9L8V2_9HELO|nr:hypothetical protein HYFRA_00013280 [Hymenoscyphus fraxineus]